MKSQYAKIIELKGIDPSVMVEEHAKNDWIWGLVGIPLTILAVWYYLKVTPPQMSAEYEYSQYQQEQQQD